MTDWLMFSLGVGLCCGMLLSHFLWVVKIREKAATGLRLEVRGRLYEVHDASAVNGGEARD